MLNLIYWEVLFWTTDWVNKVFTAQNTIDSIVWLTIGWAPYLSYTVNWRIITLTDAPATWVEIILDYYFLENVPTITNSDYTLANAKSDLLDIIRIKQFNNIYKETEWARLISEWYFTQVNSNIDKQIRWTYSFTKGANYKTLPQYRGDIIPISWVFDNYTPRTWLVLINWFATEFTTRTDSNITLPDWLTHNIESWDLVVFWYKIPTSAVDINSVKVDWVPYSRLDQSHFYWGEIADSYTVIDWYLFLYWPESRDVVVWYTKRNKLFTSDTDIIDVEPAYQRIYSLYAWFNLLARAEDARSWVVEKEYTRLKRQYIAYLKRHSKIANSSNYFNWPLNWL